jgi:hypothetical protein
MPIPACFWLADEVFPAVRAEAACRLAGVGWTQSRIAAHLSISQPMVSRYVAAPRRRRAPDALVARLADELVAGLADEAAARGAKSGAAAPATPPAWCTTLHWARAGPAADALADLLRAEQRLLAASPLAVVPQIGINLARLARPASRAGPSSPDGRASPTSRARRASPGRPFTGRQEGAADHDEVLSYPGRIVAVGDRLVPPAPPEPRTNGHLAACLRLLADRTPAVQAIASIRGGCDVRAAARKDGKVVELDGNDGPDRVVLMARALDARGAADLVHDPGGFGIEPCMYVAGPTATEVVERVLAIAARLRA